MTLAEGPPLLALGGLSKRYAAPVLSGVDFELRPGEVHALLGANGAGKTTLARIAAGLTPPDAGWMTLDGAPYAPASRAEAEARGVQIVQQEPSLIGTLSVAENLFFGRLPTRWGLVDRAALDAAARRALLAVGLSELDPATPLGSLGVAGQQLVEIAAALARRCRVLILDEPTAALTDPQVERLFDQVRRLAAGGAAILYVSHRLDELRRIADRATVLRDGRVVAGGPMAGLSLDAIVHAMVGREVERETRRESRARGEVLLRVSGLTRGARVRDVSFEVRRGEIFGLAGLVGAGRSELLRALFGADPAERGAVAVGSAAPALFRTPRAATRAGIAMVPEDRKRDGLLLPRPIRLNALLGSLRSLAGSGGWLAPARESGTAARACDRLGVRRDGLEQPAAELSGGNQQKLVVARWLLRDAEVLLFDEPTRGIDVGARAALYHLLDELAAAGRALVVASSDLEELMAICDRIGVVSAGRLVAVFPRGEWSREAITRASIGGYLGAGA